MRVWFTKKRFNPETGEPHTIRAAEYKRCDLTGIQFFEWTDPDILPYPPRIICDYGSTDPCFGSGGDEFEFGKKHDIDMHKFLGEPFHIALSRSGALVKEAARRNMDIAFALRTFRLETAKKLLEEGRVLACQLTGYHGDEAPPEYDEETEEEPVTRLG